MYFDQEPLWLLNVIEDDCYFLGVHIRLLTPCKICFTLQLLFSKIALSFPQKSHERCTKVKLFVDYKFLFDLNFKFVSGSFAFSPC